jgi:cellular nucleic acid-binding protein
MTSDNVEHNRDCYNCGKDGHRDVDYRRNRCYNCDQFGHRSRDCQDARRGPQGSEPVSTN